MNELVSLDLFRLQKLRNYFTYKEFESKCVLKIYSVLFFIRLRSEGGLATLWTYFLILSLFIPVLYHSD